MVLEYLPTKLGHFWVFYVGKYSSTMEHLGMYVYIYIHTTVYHPEIPIEYVYIYIHLYTISCIYRTWGL